MYRNRSYSVTFSMLIEILFIALLNINEYLKIFQDTSLFETRTSNVCSTIWPYTSGQYRTGKLLHRITLYMYLFRILYKNMSNILIFHFSFSGFFLLKDCNYMQINVDYFFSLNLYSVNSHSKMSELHKNMKRYMLNSNDVIQRDDL